MNVHTQVPSATKRAHWTGTLDSCADDARGKGREDDVGRPSAQVLKIAWRRGWDLNPRYPLRYVRFRGGSFQPLTHLSASDKYQIVRSFAQSETLRISSAAPATLTPPRQHN